MPRMRARSQGLAGYIADGRALRPGSPRATVIKASEKAAAQFPKDQRTCERCGVRLNRYNRDVVCRACDIVLQVEGDA